MRFSPVTVAAGLALLTASPAFAADRDAPQPFHGLTILTQEGVTARATGPNARAELKIGPFDRDAVLLADWDVQTVYAKGAAVQTNRFTWRVSADAEVLAESQPMTPSRIASKDTGPWSFSATDATKRFLPAGQAVVLSVTADNQGDLAPDQTLTHSRISVVALAAD